MIGLGGIGANPIGFEGEDYVESRNLVLESLLSDIETNLSEASLETKRTINLEAITASLSTASSSAELRTSARIELNSTSSTITASLGECFLETTSSAEITAISSPVIMGSVNNTITVSKVPEVSATKIVRIGGIEFPIDTWGSISLSQSKPNDWIQPSLGLLSASSWVGVTEAIDPTGSGTRYDIGGGNNYGTELSDLPLDTLSPGDVVNVYRRATPYREKIPITESGTALNPIIFNGVTDASGNRPEISGENAVNITPENWTSSLESSVILMHRRPYAQGGVFGETVEHVKLQNFKINKANQNYSYDAGAGLVQYPDTARLIQLRDAKNITIEGCLIHEGGEGIFAQSPDGGEGNCRNITIRSNWFRDCGYAPNAPGEYNAHQIYLIASAYAGEKNIIEGNFFDRTADTEVAQVKLRTTDTIFRYNTVTGNDRMLDLVEAQDGVQETVFSEFTAQEVIDRYRTSHVYGNLFIIDSRTAYPMSGYPIHCGWDSFEFNTNEPGLGQPSNRGIDGGTTYFFNNTIHYHSVYANGGNWRGGIFEPGFHTVSNDQGSITAANNIIEFGGDMLAAHGRIDGIVNYESANLIYSGTLPVLAESDSYANSYDESDDPQIAINHNDTRITGSANFIESDNVDIYLRNYYPNTGSPAIGAATALPLAISTYQVEYSPVDLLTGIMPVRGSTNDLGAFE